MLFLTVMRTNFLNLIIEKNNKITFSYLGNFYGKRTPEPLLKAIDQIRIQNPKLLNNIFFNFYGSQDEISQDIIDKFNFSERLVKFNSPISYIKSLEKNAAS